jgi:DNA-binding NarL/FixJ family response regulator
MTSATPHIRVVLAEDHETVRQGLRALLASVEGLDVVDEVGDSESAITSVRGLQPDILILDLAMPGPGGLATIRQLAREQTRTAIVVLTRFRDPAFVHEAMSAGASAYVLKQSSFAEVEHALAHALRGERYLDRRLGLKPEQVTPSYPARQVSRREEEVLHRAALGQSNKEIATGLGIAVKTVEAHKTQGMRKLELRDRSALVRYATLQGWLREP